MADFKTIDDIDVSGKRVLVRSDLNVPMKDGKVTDTTRIDRSCDTIRDLTAKGAKVVVVSHFGRPKGKRVPEMSLKPVAEALGQALGTSVAFADDCVGPAAETVVNGLASGEVALLENLRFHAEEEKNDPAFARNLAELADVYVNDAFSTAHRAHASTEAVANLLPSAAGRLMQAELEALTKALQKPERPAAALVGGAKISTKLDVLGNLVEKVDMIVIGGGMANTFLFAKGIEIGKSLCESDMAGTAREIMEKAEKAGCEIVLPTDVVVADKFEEGAANETVPADAVPADKMILDIGPDSVEALKKKLADCKTLVWNGPLGAFEIKPFDAATNAVAQEAAKLTKAGSLLTVAGGGDTVSALANAGVEGQFSYVSTAGGAFLEWMEGKTLPGVAALED
ncbi:Phosphoglycerate kinase [Caenispirillum salinarum AK4]|uniref:Phosphoglycerate kinase n=1 Tax=Caenispirillum salinarum AK4 TaxID=1238182 RepID=K9HHG1_9PROT|nr:phosphoglycerate kinase [Caenispirillum salinarum]EKV28056.1 Phosphoglycerate kinase [Caenispirillum salinarum AK4]